MKRIAGMGRVGSRVWWPGTVLLLLLGALGAHAESPRVGLVVEVEGLRSERGLLRALLFEGEEGFPGEPGRALRLSEVQIEGERARLLYADLPPGQYAVTVFHDENENAALDMNFIGWPREGVGASRGAHKRMGPPRYKDARFELGEGVRTERIELLYPPL